MQTYWSQSTIKMEKGYYVPLHLARRSIRLVAIHNKNGKGLLRIENLNEVGLRYVAIHNKNGKGLLLYCLCFVRLWLAVAIHNKNGKGLLLAFVSLFVLPLRMVSQSTIKMEKGYYEFEALYNTVVAKVVAIHNKNGKGLLLWSNTKRPKPIA